MFEKKKSKVKYSNKNQIEILLEGFITFDIKL